MDESPKERRKVHYLTHEWCSYFLSGNFEWNYWIHMKVAVDPSAHWYAILEGITLKKHYAGWTSNNSSVPTFLFTANSRTPLSCSVVKSWMNSSQFGVFLFFFLPWQPWPWRSLPWCPGWACVSGQIWSPGSERWPPGPCRLRTPRLAESSSSFVRRSDWWCSLGLSHSWWPTPLWEGKGCGGSPLSRVQAPGPRH